MKKRTQTGQRPRHRADSQMKKRTQTGGVNGPFSLTVVIAEKAKVKPPAKNDFASC